MAKTTCRDCNRTVFVVQLDAGPAMLDPELIKVVTARSGGAVSASGGGVVMGTRETFARRLHAERCQGYQDEACRARIAAEQREYNEKNGRPPRRNRGL